LPPVQGHRQRAPYPTAGTGHQRNLVSDLGALPWCRTDQGGTQCNQGVIRPLENQLCSVLRSSSSVLRQIHRPLFGHIERG
jgi:hypothetical protein